MDKFTVMLIVAMIIGLVLMVGGIVGLASLVEKNMELISKLSELTVMPTVNWSTSTSYNQANSDGQ